MDSEGCGRIPAPFSEIVSCVWDSRPLLDAGHLFNIYQRRWWVPSPLLPLLCAHWSCVAELLSSRCLRREFFARAARMGFNVLGLDAGARDRCRGASTAVLRLMWQCRTLHSDASADPCSPAVADTMLVADFYSFVKSPPFAQVNLLTQDDGGGALQ